MVSKLSGSRANGISDLSSVVKLLLSLDSVIDNNCY